MSAICATIDYINDFNLQEQCNKLSEFVKEELDVLWKQYDCIGDIRIAGLLISIELVKSRETTEKHDELAEKILYYCLENGLSFKIAGGNCITWHPPLIVSKEQLTFAIKLLAEGLRKYS